MLRKAFIILQLSYCPLVWMFHSRNTKKRINKIHERALGLVYDDSTYLGFDELLTKDKSVSIHQINVQLQATETFKVKNEVSAELIEDIFILLINPTICEITEYGVERETGLFFMVQKVFLLYLQESGN